MSLQHPAAQQEQEHLAQTLALVAEERLVALQEKANAEGELSHARMYDPDALPIRELLYMSALTSLHNLDRTAKKPYFTRIDFTEQEGVSQTYYIGKYGLSRTSDHQVEVVDWRAPVANLYYSGQIGPMHYTVPEGEIAGELTLKRQIGIEDGRLETLFDTDLVSQDAYLQSVLGAMTGDRLREIVTTIQAEQNFVIRYPLNRTLIVQGVAGSGKTTIALHRIAYLLYAFRETLQPEQLLILAPNPLFLNYISGVLPDLGVERVQQSTFSLWMEGYLQKWFPKVDRRDRTDEILALSAQELERTTAIAQVKGSLQMAQLVENWLNRFEKGFCPRNGLSFGPVALYTHEELKQFLLVDEKPFPLQRRLQEFEKQLKPAVQGAARRINAWLAQECEKRAAAILSSVSDEAQRREKIRALYKSRDERQKQTLAQVKPFLTQAMSSFPSLDPAALYHAFWTDLRHHPHPEIAMAAQYTCDRLAQNLPLEAEDIALFLLIVLRVCSLERKDVRHIVIDEAQDFSALEVYALHKALPHATMTIVGDMMQGMHSWRAIGDWNPLCEEVFAGKAVMHHLVTSYRSTVEIMDFAARVARNRPVPGQKLAQPVLRHAQAPEVLRMDDWNDRCQHTAEAIRQWQSDGFSTVAVIVRKAEDLERLRLGLPKDLQAHILDVNAQEYHGGVVLAHAGAVKGLEFDGVILFDASSEAFPNRELEARVLYVCLTRALHRLMVLYAGEISPLLV